MSRQVLTTTLLVFLGTWALSTGAQNPPDTAPNAPDEVATQPESTRPGTDDEAESIRRAAQAYATAFNEGEAAAILKFWAEDADYRDGHGTHLKGREAIGRALEENLAADERRELAIETRDVRFLRPDIAVEDGTLTFTAADGTAESNDYTAVWTKAEEGWQICSVRDQPSADATPRNAAHEALRPLEWLVGTWRHEDDHGSVTLDCRWILDRSFLQVEYTGRGRGEQTMTVEYRIGWNPEFGQLRSWVFDSMGGHGEGLWTRDGNAWHIDSNGVLPGGGRATAVNTLRFVDENTFAWAGRERQVDGLPLMDTEVTFERVNAAPEESRLTPVSREISTEVKP